MFKGYYWNEFPTPVKSSVQEKIIKEFPTAKIEQNGVMRNAWLPQNDNDNSSWQNDMRIDFGFPEDVNYAAGDVLIRLYEFRLSQIKLIQKYIAERFADKD